jgi:hypothetical protein
VSSASSLPHSSTCSAHLTRNKENSRELIQRFPKARKERELRGGIAPITGGVTIKEAIDAFTLERTASQDANSVRRWQWELNRFTSVTGKTYLSEIDREDVFTYWNSYKAQGAKPRTIHNRVQSLLTFLKNRGIVGLLKSNEMPSYDEKDVDYYTENKPTELTDFFAACNPEERLAFMFFLYSGCRFFNFLNICLHNRSLTILERMRKNPACRKDNLSVAASSDLESSTVDDEYIHSHSESVQRKSAQESSSVEKRLLAKRFIEFVLVNEPRLYGTVFAIADARTLREAQETLRVDEATMIRDHRRIIQLKDAFLDGGPIPKQRRPYRKRTEKAHSSISIVLAT